MHPSGFPTLGSIAPAIFSVHRGMETMTPVSAEYDAGVRRQQVFHDQFKKTVVCRFFLNNACTRGTNCNFAHNAVELREMPDLWKTAMCKQWKQGLCPFSNEYCSFAHGKHEFRISPAFLQHATGKQLPPPVPHSESTWSDASGESLQSLPSDEFSPQLDEVMPSLQFGMPQLIASDPDNDKLVGDASMVDPPEIQILPSQCSSQRSKVGETLNTLEDLKHYFGASDTDHGQHETTSMKALPMQPSCAESLLAPATPPQPRFLR